MRKIERLLNLGIVFVLVFSLCMTGCGKKDNQVEAAEREQLQPEEEPIKEELSAQLTALKIGTMESISTELLEQLKPQLQEEGFRLEIVPFEDSTVMDEALIHHEIDAHLFAHIPYIESYNHQHTEQLKSEGVGWYEVFSIYKGLKEDLTSVTEGTTLAIPAEGVDRARALLLLNEIGLITVDPQNREFLNQEDIIENPKGLQLVELSKDEFETAKEQFDFLLMGAFVAAQCGYDTMKDPLQSENKEMPGVQIMGTQLVTTETVAHREGIEALQRALEAEELQAYLQYRLKGTVATK